MSRPWEADPSANWKKRVGESPEALGTTEGNPSCPDVWELSNGDYAIIGRDMTDALAPRVPADAGVAHDERVVVVPKATLLSAAKALME